MGAHVALGTLMRRNSSNSILVACRQNLSLSPRGSNNGGYMGAKYWLLRCYENGCTAT